ncbi:MAG: hypothetical protein ACI4UM_05710, partial [Succinivibrio sp.]
MKSTFIKSAFLSLAVLFSTVLAADFNSDEKAKIEQIIDDYVSNHPEIIIRAMKKLEESEKARHDENV